MATTTTNTMRLFVSFRGTQHIVETLSDELLTALQTKLEELTRVPPSLQKLLFKGKKASIHAETTTLEQAGLKDGMKIQLVGSTETELINLQTVENERRKKEEILRQRDSSNLPKVRYYFCSIFETADQ